MKSYILGNPGKTGKAVWRVAGLALVLLSISTSAFSQVGEKLCSRLSRPLCTITGGVAESRPPENVSAAPLFRQQTRAPKVKSVEVRPILLSDGLQKPWGLAVLPGGDLLISEKQPGRLKIFGRRSGLSPPLSGLDSLAHPGKLGLLDVALSRDFAQNHRIYFSYFEVLSDRKTNTNLAYATLDAENRAVHNIVTIFRGFPETDIKNVSLMQGGRIAIASDFTVFLTMGDRDDRNAESYLSAMAQRLDNDLGKIVHLTPDGAPARNNPFINTPGARPEIWAFGIRSPEGLAFDRHGELWETEHGPRGGDELNQIKRGGNYGWPLVSYGIDYSGEKIREGATVREGTEQPIYYWDPVIAPSGLVIYDGKMFPSWKGSLLVGGLRGHGIFRLGIERGRVTSEEPVLTELNLRVRDVAIGGGGEIYVITDEGKLYCVEAVPPSEVSRFY